MSLTKIEDRNFEERLTICEYELHALSELLLLGKSERWVPGYSNRIVEQEHTNRYEWATKHVEGLEVLDISCGSGMGSYLLAEKGKAKGVYGFDISSKAIAYAKSKYKHPNLRFEIQNAETFSSSSQFDVVVSFETIEHIQNNEKFLTNICSSLKQRGLLIISTPISGMHGVVASPNPYHLQEWGFFAFQEIISASFLIQDTFLQLRVSEFYKHALMTRLKARVKKLFRQANNIYNHEMECILWDKSTSQLKPIGKRLVGYQIVLARKL